jgi:hypothetical protein
MVMLASSLQPIVENQAGRRSRAELLLGSPIALPSGSGSSESVNSDTCSPRMPAQCSAPAPEGDLSPGKPARGPKETPLAL